VLRKMLGPKRDEVTGELRTLHKGETLWSLLVSKYCLGDQIRNNKTDGACSTHWGRRGAYRAWVGKPEENRPLGRPGIDGRIILKRIFNKWFGCRAGLMWLRKGTSGGFLWMP
jgi:hypothetical protein